MSYRGCNTTSSYLSNEQGVTNLLFSRMNLERTTIEGDSPVYEINLSSNSILSRTEHVKFCLNLPGPSGKAKYSRETDSEQVP